MLHLKRIELSTEYDLKLNELNNIHSKFVNSLSMKQYNIFRKYGTRFNGLTLDQLNTITKNKKWKNILEYSQNIYRELSIIDNKLELVINNS